MDLYLDVTRVVDRALTDDVTGVAAHVLEQYLREDELLEEKGTLESLMKYSECFLMKMMDVFEQAEKDPRWYLGWKKAMSSGLNDHSSRYNVFYQGISHMTAAPYFVTDWSVCYVVESVLETLSLGDKEVDRFTKEELEHVHYMVRFGENLLQELYHAWCMVHPTPKK
jgi:hypothetical protein